MSVDLSRMTISDELFAEQIVYYRQHLDVFIEDMFAPIR